MTSVSDYVSVRTTAQMMLRNEITNNPGTLETSTIRDTVVKVVVLFGSEEFDIERLTIELDSQFQTIMGEERVLSEIDGGWTAWLANRRSSITWGFWDHYYQHLANEKGLPQVTVERLNASTDRVLGLITDPMASGAWDRRGMVVGHVQSGKTAHYTGVICKAADAGYKVIIVLTGMSKSLRSQTQVRLEEGFLGYDRGATMSNPGDGRVTVGVGNPELYPNHPLADSVTTRADNGDFSKAITSNFAINPGGHPLLFVVKKNGPVLRNLLSWLDWAAQDTDDDGNAYIRDIPLLLIDDECDLGSIDTRKGAFDENGDPDPDHDPAVFNELTRRLLNLFDQSAYVGYTATPFANIFIHERATTKDLGEDLLPRSFIVSLPTPSDYLGPLELLGDDSDDSTGDYPTVREITDHALTLELKEREGWIPPLHNKEHVPLWNGVNRMPPSLQEAIRAFILSSAARRARGDRTAHNSMLVHVTRLTAVQEKVAEQIRTEVLNIRARLRHSNPGESDNYMDQLRALWHEDYEPTHFTMRSDGLAQDCVPVNWDDVEPQIIGVVDSIEIREINGYAGEVLDYLDHESSGLCVIAVGGDKLSRGLTLEGLSVSYFLRASKMYDTLMQMGRWFGYRPRYSDLCRLYTTPEMIEWFEHIALASEELREEFNLMANSGGTPRDFGLRVKSHPVMLVTSRVKMRHGVTLNLSFEGDVSETINFRRDRDHLQGNWSAAERLFERIRAANGEPRRGYLRDLPENRSDNDPGSGPVIWEGVSANLIQDFLIDYSEHPASRRVITALLQTYVAGQTNQNRLINWTVLVANGESADTHTITGVSLNQVNRSWHGSKVVVKSLIEHDHFRIRRLVNPLDESADLTQAEFDKALAETTIAWKSGDSKRKTAPTIPAGWAMRKERPSQNGLLILYPISSTWMDKKKPFSIVDQPDSALPVLGFAISFPGYDPDNKSLVQYVVDNRYWTQEYEAADQELAL